MRKELKEKDICWLSEELLQLHFVFSSELITPIIKQRCSDPNPTVAILFRLAAKSDVLQTSAIFCLIGPFI